MDYPAQAHIEKLEERMDAIELNYRMLGLMLKDALLLSSRVSILEAKRIPQENIYEYIISQYQLLYKQIEALRKEGK